MSPDQTMNKATILIYFVLICHSCGCRGGFDYIAAERSHLKSIGLAAEMYKLAHGKYPLDLASFADYLEGKDLEDVWGTVLRYRSNETRFDLVSAGPDRKFTTSDDLSLASEFVLERQVPKY